MIDKITIQTDGATGYPLWKAEQIGVKVEKTETFADGGKWYRGKLSNGRHTMLISFDDLRFRVSGSLSKWTCGDNWHNLTREEIGAGIAELSEMLDSSANTFDVLEIELSANIETDSTPVCYFNGFGNLRGFVRSKMGSSLYYIAKAQRYSRELYIYDKLAQLAQTGETIPFVDNLLRVEYRAKGGQAIRKIVGNSLLLGQITDSDVWQQLANTLSGYYASITKNVSFDKVDIVMSDEQMKIEMAVAYIQSRGGIDKVLELCDSIAKTSTDAATRRKAYRRKRFFEKAWTDAARLGFARNVESPTDEITEKLEQWRQERVAECV